MPTRVLQELRARLKTESGDSIRLVENLAENPICSVRHLPELHCIGVTWRGYATSTQSRYIHESILELLRQHGVRKLLGDDTALPNVAADDRFWIVRDWMPRAMEAGLRVIANIRSAAHWCQVSVEQIASDKPPGLLMQSFDSREAAEAWLLRAD